MKISVISYSLSEQPATLEQWESKLMGEINSLMADGSKIILYPELCLMGLSQYLPDYQQISHYTQTVLLEKIGKILKGKDMLLCLGSGPRQHEGRLYNSSPVWVKDIWMFQDKIHLTPWETDFTPGTNLNFFEYKGLKTAVVICYDIEQPGLGLALKRNGIDLILCPSATTNKNGNQRVNRCASARSIEVGACVITAPLVGDSKHDLIDHSEGRQGFFMPAQEVVVVEQESFSDYSVKATVINHYDLEVDMMKQLKQKDGETKPYFKEDLILP